MGVLSPLDGGAFRPGTIKGDHPLSSGLALSRQALCLLNVL
jgi:hypothetical protein